jgi:CRP-like cAMP-binding protein/Zn-dependent protease
MPPQLLTLSDKKNILSKQPLLQPLTIIELEELAGLLSETFISTGEIIVKEHDLINTIYFIVTGKAEVSRQELQGGNLVQIPLAVLNAGESIGLSDSGFYSSTNTRTATVTALEPCHLLKLDMAAFHAFSKLHFQSNNAIMQKAEWLSRIKLIKQAAPFAKLTLDEQVYLADQVTQITATVGELIFSQGDKGEHCYLIQKGKVEIFIKTKDGSEARLATLKSSMIFGEAALLTNLPRNASARALKETELLMLKKDDLIKLTQKDKHVSKTFKALLLNRSRPKQSSMVEAHTTTGDDQEKIMILKDTVKGNYYRLSDEGYFIWQLLDGSHTLRDIAMLFYNEYDVFDTDTISDFIVDLQQEGFVESSGVNEEALATQSLWVRSIIKIKSIMEFSINFNNVDDWISRSYQKGIKIFFTPFAQIIFLLAIIVGIFAFVTAFQSAINVLKQMSGGHKVWLLVGVVLINLPGVFVHELAHAYTTKAFGFKVKNFGVGWYWLGPMAFCDTSDMWLSTKWKRITVDAAGMYMDLFMGSVAAIIALLIQNDFLILMFWLVALSNYLGVIYNMSPILELDGYYILSNLLKRDNLREDAVLWLVNESPRSEKSLKEGFFKPERVYWILCVVYLACQFVISFIVSHLVLYGLLGVNNIYLTILPPIFVIFFSSLSVFAEVRKKRKVADENSVGR